MKDAKSAPGPKLEKNKIYMKDVILLPSPRAKKVPKGKDRESLFTNGFVISSFELHTIETEDIIREKLMNEFKDLFPQTSNVKKFDFVRAVEKKIVPVKKAGEMNGRCIYNVAGQRDRPIYIRALDDLTWVLESKSSLLESDSGSDYDAEELHGVSESPVSLEEEVTQPKEESDILEIAEDRSESACPVCQKFYPIETLQAHANACIDFKPAFEIDTEVKELAEENDVSHFDENKGNSLQEVLCEKSKKFCNDSSARTRFSVRLNNAYVDTMKKMNLFQKGRLLKPISVDFVGEVAIDDGGPLRELFTCVFDSATGHVLSGPEKNYTIRHDAHKLEKGGAGPHNWCRPLANYVLGLECSEISVDDIPDYEVQEKLKLVINSKSQAELNEVLLDFDARFEAGYNKPTVDISDVDDLVKKVARYYVISRQLEEIQQLCSGMESEGVLDVLRKYPGEAVNELIHATKQVPAALIKGIFKIEFDPDKDSEKRKQEEDVIFWWQQCLDELEMEQTEEVEVHDISGGIKHTKPTLLDVLHFLTGSKYPPSTHSMQQKGRITFFHNCPGRRIEASTCQLILKIPVNERYNSELFTFSFIEDIMQAPGFGLL
eukprot:Seg8529.2 transcript_id=Seg8529.2/GoldUCD/mRNA.D3Y31 product="G2/M phase-specific E3 ubiquitin-protein ligase" protein_id=Seg8529.2/GoldUCD/D3Y31